MRAIVLLAILTAGAVPHTQDKGAFPTRPSLPADDDHLLCEGVPMPTSEVIVETVANRIKAANEVAKTMRAQPYDVTAPATTAIIDAKPNARVTSTTMISSTMTSAIPRRC